MLRLKFFLLLLSIFGLTGCNGEEGNIKASGHSEHWDVQITYTLTSDNVQQKGTLTYLGDTTPREMQYYYPYPTSSDDETVKITSDDGNFQKTHNIGASSYHSKVDNQEIFKTKVNETIIKITWQENGEQKEEQIQLHVE